MVMTIKNRNRPPAFYVGSLCSFVPFVVNPFSTSKDTRNALYQRDADQAIRLSCDNPEIKAIYDEFLGKSVAKNISLYNLSM